MVNTLFTVIVTYKALLLVVAVQAVQCYLYNRSLASESEHLVNQSAYNNDKHQETDSDDDMKLAGNDSIMPQQNFPSEGDTDRKIGILSNIAEENSPVSMSRYSIQSRGKSIFKNICGHEYMCSKMGENFDFPFWSNCCPVCSCHPSCFMARSCCPDVKPNIYETTLEGTVCMPLYNILTKAIFSQSQRQPGQEKVISTGQNMYGSPSLDDTQIYSIGTHNSHLHTEFSVVSSCPSDYFDQDLSQHCLQSNSVYTRDYIPVFDTITKKIFLNYFCALCNNVTLFFPLDIVTNCTQIYLLDDIPVYLDDLRRITKNCLVYIDPYKSQMTETEICHKDRQEGSTISICNKTGLWDQYNAETETLCLKGDHIVPYWTEEGNTTYRNIYCYICNTQSDIYENKTCTEQDEEVPENIPDDPFETLNIRVSTDIYTKKDYDHRLQTPEIATALTHKNKLCRKDFLRDVYNDQCRPFVCPVHQIPLYTMCLQKNNKVTGLTLVGKLHIKLLESPIYIYKDQPDKHRKTITAMQNTITNYLEVEKHGCIHVPGEVYANIEDRQINNFYILYKIQNTDTCTVGTVVDIFKNIATRESVVTQQHTNTDGPVPRISIQMTYKKVLPESFTMKIEPDGHKSTKQHELLLNASFYCPRVVLNISEYNNFVENGILKPAFQSILDQQYTSDTGLIEICLEAYLEHWLTQKQKDSRVASKSVYTIDVTVSTIATIVSMLSISMVLITYCTFPELRFIPGKLVMVLSTNLLLAQAFYAFGLDLGVDNIWCKIFGICIHFFWLSTIFSMNSILLLLIRSLHKPLHVDNRAMIESRSTSEFFKHVVHCYLLPGVCVIINSLSSTLQLTQQFGYGGQLCYIREERMKLYTFLVPMGTVMCINFILFALIMLYLRIYIKTTNKNVDVQQIFIFFKLVTMTGLYWIFGFLYELTYLTMFKYLFIALTAGQGFFLMWSFICNWRVYELYKTAIIKFIRKLREEMSQSYSLS